LRASPMCGLRSAGPNDASVFPRFNLRGGCDKVTCRLEINPNPSLSPQNDLQYWWGWLCESITKMIE